MSDLETMLKGLPDALAAAVEQAKVPAASMGVLLDGELFEAAAGVLNTRTGVEATPDSLFQIGSITKVYTGTLVMQLVDAGQVDLDTPVRTYVPEFRVADADASERITVRHLLTHTSGFDGGDYFVDTGRGDDAYARYVTTLAELGQITAPGKRYSYNNAGYTVLGRLIELVTGQPYDDALRDRLLLPAGLEHSFTLPEDVVLYRVGAGHVAGEDGGPPVPVKQWGMNRSGAPAGAICSTAADVVGFARIHMDEGRSPSGNQVLSAASVKAMQEPQIDYTGDARVRVGLSWILTTHEGLRDIWHTGGTLGQAAWLHAFPERKFAISFLTNGPGAAAAWSTVSAYVLDKVLSLPPMKPRVPEAPESQPDLDLSRYVGKYVRRAVHTTVRPSEDGGLEMQIEYVNMPYDLTPPPPYPLKAVDEQTFVAFAGEQPALSMTFYDFDDEGRPALLFASRMSRRE